MTRAVGAMEPELFSKVIQEIRESPGCSVKIGGLGEPALHPDLANMMARIRENRIRAILYTNGTLLREYGFEQIVSWGLHRLVVSIDGLDEHSYERQRVGGNYQEVRQRVTEYFARAQAS